MNAYDALLWKSGREKVDAGLPLTERERAVLMFYGGETILQATKQLTTRHSTTKIHTTSLEGKLRFS